MQTPDIRIPFRSKQDWDKWLKENPWARNKENILAYVLAGMRGGITSKLLGDISTDKLSYTGENHRESYRSIGFNGRQRYLLDEIFTEAESKGGRQARIYAPEAVTDLALIMRGRYPYFIGTEYIENESERASVFPVVFGDLGKLPFPSESFDLIFSGDVFEHLPHLKKCLFELRRIIKPGGTMIASFPFSDTQHTVVFAELKDGEIIHRRPARYHGNPVDPKGSLVFTFPGWNILEACREAGWSDAAMLFRANAELGIVGNEYAGDFMLRAVA